MIYFVTNRSHNQVAYPKISSFKDLDSFINGMIAKNIPIGIDTETNGLDPYLSELLLISIGDEVTQFVIDFPSLDNVDIKLLNNILDKPNLILAGHNIKFDYKQLKAHGIVIKRHVRLYDTMIADQILGQGSSRRNSLAEVAKRRIGVDLSKETRSEFIYMDSNSELATRHVQYAAKDVTYLNRILREQIALRNKYNLGVRFKNEMALVPIIGDLELEGIGFDKDAWLNTAAENRAKLFELKLKMDHAVAKIMQTKGVNKPEYRRERKHQSSVTHDMFDNTPTVIENKNLGNVNYSSEKQIKQIFIDAGEPLPVDKHGDITTGKEALVKYIVDTEGLSIMVPFIELLLQYSKINKQLSSFGEAFAKNVHRTTGKIHTIYRQCSTDTGRFASGDTKNGYPNMSQIPKDLKFRHPFIAKPGYKIITIDFTACELTILASVSGDKKLIELLMDESQDLHTYLANAAWRAFKSDPDYEVTDEERTQFKGVNFGLIYGATPMRIAQLLGISIEGGQLIEGVLRQEIPQVFNYLDTVSQRAIRYGFVVFNKRTNSRRWFMDVFAHRKEGSPLPPTVRGEIERAAKNAPIQGTNADLMKESMVKIDRYFQKYKIPAQMLLQVYDELVIEVREDRAEEVAKEVQKIMNATADLYLRTGLGIHMRSGYKIENSWTK